MYNEKNKKIIPKWKLEALEHLYHSSGELKNQVVKFGHYWLSKSKDICKKVLTQGVSTATLSGHSHLLSHTKSGLFVEGIEVINPIKFQNIGTCDFRGVGL